MIEASNATQIRKTLDRQVIDAYKEDIEHGAIMPPLIVFAEQGSQRFILADGFHRLLAAINAGQKEVDVEVHEGRMLEALIYALGANAGHGLRRTNADKVNAVKIALKDPAISQMTQREIADICRVSHSTVCREIRRSTLGGKSGGNGEPGTSQPVEPFSHDIVRPTRPAPTQNTVDRGELIEALRMIRGIPYSGCVAYRTLELSNEMDPITYVVDWLTEILNEHLRFQHKSIDGQSADNDARE